MTIPNTNTTVLLVEDEAIIALATRRKLESNGFTVEVVHTGEDAVTTVRSGEAVDVILMDIDLGPGIDGTSAAQRILQDRVVPIIFLTSHAEREYVERARKIAGYGYVLKNSGEFVLVQSIRMAMELFASHLRLQEEKEKYRQVVDNTEDAIVTFDGSAVIRFTNPAAAMVLDRPVDELVGRSVDTVVSRENADVMHRAIKDAIQTGTTQHLELSVSAKGAVRLFATRFIPVFDGDGHVLAFFTDITQRSRAEAERREYAQLLQTMIDQTPDHVFVKDRSSRFILTNDSHLRVLGAQSVHDVIGKTDYDFFPQAMADRYYRDEQEVMATGRRLIDREEEVEDADGNRRWYITTKLALRDDEGAVTGLLGISRDISERRHAEADLRRALDEQVQVVSEVNHRVKNNLLVIQSLVNLKDRSLGDAADLSDLRNHILAIQTVHDRLLPADRNVNLDLGRYLRNLLDGVFEVYEGAPVSASVTDAGPPVAAKAAVTCGLIVNELATNAMKHGFPSVAHPVFVVRSWIDEDTHQRVLAISNNGPPFPEIAVETPAPESGMGLRLVRSLVGQLDGTVHMSRTETPTVTVRFPGR